MQVGDLDMWQEWVLLPPKPGIVVELAPEGSDLAEVNVVVMWSSGAEWCHTADLEVISGTA